VFEGMRWMNEPPRWSFEGDTLEATTGHKTDFWRETFYDFIRDNGHFFHKDVTGDFTARVTLVGEYETLYDQSGLMLRVDERNWIKTGIEFTNGTTHLSAVFTRDYSDWSVVAVPEYSGELTLRITRYGTAVRIEFLSDGGWQLLRLGYLPIPETCQIGVMCCSPEREGFEARFKDFSISEPISEDPHA
jgi:regulation of enolase protein 1 (concanavalin A-like superfamily)